MKAQLQRQAALLRQQLAELETMIAALPDDAPKRWLWECQHPAGSDQQINGAESAGGFPIYLPLKDCFAQHFDGPEAVPGNEYAVTLVSEFQPAPVPYTLDTYNSGSNEWQTGPVQAGEWVLL